MEPMTSRDINRDFDRGASGPINEPISSYERESWKDMIQNLYTDINQLWIKERELVKAELNEKATEIKTSVSSFGIGGALLFVGLFAAVATAIIVVDLFTPLWVSAVIVTALLLVVGFVMVKTAQKRLNADRLKPTHSIDAFGEIKNTFQERIHEFKKH